MAIHLIVPVGYVPESKNEITLKLRQYASLDLANSVTAAKMNETNAVVLMLLVALLFLGFVTLIVTLFVGTRRIIK